jgi:putative chitinase
MTPVDLLLWGALFGAIGQLVRALIGLKKAWDDATVANAPFVWDGKRFFVGLGLGVAVGVVAGLFSALVITPAASGITKEQILLLAASGYAGADALEGLFTRSLPK